MIATILKLKLPFVIGVEIKGQDLFSINVWTSQRNENVSRNYTLDDAYVRYLSGVSKGVPIPVVLAERECFIEAY